MGYFLWLSFAFYWRVCLVSFVGPCLLLFDRFLSSFSCCFCSVRFSFFHLFNVVVQLSFFILFSYCNPSFFSLYFYPFFSASPLSVRLHFFFPSFLSLCLILRFSSSLFFFSIPFCLWKFPFLSTSIYFPPFLSLPLSLCLLSLLFLSLSHLSLSLPHLSCFSLTHYRFLAQRRGLICNHSEFCPESPHASTMQPWPQYFIMQETTSGPSYYVKKLSSAERPATGGGTVAGALWGLRGF